MIEIRDRECVTPPLDDKWADFEVDWAGLGRILRWIGRAGADIATMATLLIM